MAIGAMAKSLISAILTTKPVLFRELATLLLDEVLMASRCAVISTVCRFRVVESRSYYGKGLSGCRTHRKPSIDNAGAVWAGNRLLLILLLVEETLDFFLRSVDVAERCIMTKVGLRIDVDTLRGTREGVPRLLATLHRHGVQASFFLQRQTGRIWDAIFWRLIIHDFMENATFKRRLALRQDILLAGTARPGKISAAPMPGLFVKRQHTMRRDYMRRITMRGRLTAATGRSTPA